ncbi:U3 snoRNP protein [Malassezia psittaci]|uniref:U3 snoRNP protein n=1 Tax=Malassezia psittaci TaxID=1821823 RepID=A0AAF0FB22_9BASI|nr:U3 snoRNP protein [Malassezia psittaci]
MKSSFEFSNLCGTVYQQGNVQFGGNGDTLYSPVGNRLAVFDLVRNVSFAMPFETRKPIMRVAVSPKNSHLVLVADEDGHALLMNTARRSLLAHMSFKLPARDIQFSPDGRFLAVTHGTQVQVWRTPNVFVREFAPFVLHRTYVGHSDDVISITWSKNSRFFLSTSKDMTARLFSLDPVPGFRPKTFTGHRDAVLQAYFSLDERTIYTVSRDGACLTWSNKDSQELMQEESGDTDLGATEATNDPENYVAFARWGVMQRNYFHQANTQVVCAAFHAPTSRLVVGFTSGLFSLWDMPDFQSIHALSISQDKISSVAINESGEWLAFGAQRLGQLLVWEWASESYILKQQGHFFDMNTLAYAQDGQTVVTGGDDGKVKLWNTVSGFCTVTFSEHSAAISQVEFAKQGQVLFSASLDGTVRAYDLVRYRNFRTFTSPNPVQFVSLAVEPSGEVVCAGSADVFETYMWSVQTGKLLDILAGHEGPVTSLQFDPAGSGLLASTSWDRTVRLWEVFKRSGATEAMQLNAEGLALAYRPDGHEICVASLDGHLSFFDPQNGASRGVLDCRRDISGGRSVNDKVARRNNAAGAAFTSVCYSADGSCVLAGGNANYVCLYDVRERVLLKRWKLSKNLLLDGTQDRLDSRQVTDAGNVALINDLSDEDELTLAERQDRSLPGAQRGDLSKRSTRPLARAKCVRFSPTGQSWAAASTSGLLLYALDTGSTFDPTDLDMELTPQSVRSASLAGDALLALLGALRLSDPILLVEVYERVKYQEVPLIARQLPQLYVAEVLKLVASRLDPSSESPHVEFHLHWLSSLFNAHGEKIRELGHSSYAPVLRAAQMALNELRANIKTVCDENTAAMLYVYNGLTARHEQQIQDTL